MAMRQSGARNALAVGSMGLVLLAPCAGAATASRSSSGALLSPVNRAYRQIPGIELTATVNQSRQFLLGLLDGTVTEEEFIAPGRHGVRLVARRGGSTFMRAAGDSCWRRLHNSNPRWVLKSPVGVMGRLDRSDPRSLLNVGYPFPEHGKVLVQHSKTGARKLVIETHSAFWFLAGSLVPQKIARKSFLTIEPNPVTHKIRSIQVTAPEPEVRATLTVKPLKASPSIPRPMPTC
jgi:hypothetical protein